MKTLVVSAVNIYTGGPLTIVCDFLRAVTQIPEFISGNLRVIVFCHDEALYHELRPSGIEFIAKPKSRRSWIFRLYYEYIGFWLWSRNREIDCWISLHDTTPCVNASKQIVYCHNPSPFYQGYSNWLESPRFEIFRRVYKYLYRINIKKNTFIVVQQQWMRERFVEDYGCDPNAVVVARPVIKEHSCRDYIKRILAPYEGTYIIYPAFPRVFKNHVILLKAMSRLADIPLRLILTISGNENKYARRIAQKAANLKNVKLIGLLPHKEILACYSEVDAMVFPSNLETWGLPLSEFRLQNKPIFAANLPYARETLAGYQKSLYFDPDNDAALSEILRKYVKDKEVKFESSCVNDAPPFVNNWEQLLDYIELA